MDCTYIVLWATTQSAFTLNSPMYTLMATMQSSQPQIWNLIIHTYSFSIHTPLTQQREQFVVKCLAQGCIDMWTKLPISGRLPYPISKEAHRHFYRCMYRCMYRQWYWKYFKLLSAHPFYLIFIEPPPEEQKGFSLEEKSKTSKKRVHYMKFTKGGFIPEQLTFHFSKTQRSEGYMFNWLLF